MSSELEQQVAYYQRWRDQMIAGIESYKQWLDANGYADIQQSLRIYDLIESLKNDRMTLAFLAEFSRGKTELINAMFFSDFKKRLLPSNIGRTTMCPTEIFHDATDEPYIKLLPIETRKRQESVNVLKRQAVEWIKIKLNVESSDAMAVAMQHLVETKSVSIEEAKALGLWDETNPEITTVVVKDDHVDVPSWRHAMISYPHPLLKSGLTVLDTPGLNALGTEPELTLSMIPNAHAVLFLLAMDTGVTKSDLEVWQRYVQPAVTRRIAVLNKIDLMWDDLKSQEEIDTAVDRQLETTATLLNLSSNHVLAISAQKALIARVKEDGPLLKKSGIERLEHLLASEIIPAKQEILRSAVEREIGGMVDASKLAVDSQLASTHGELKELSVLSGKNKAVAQAMVQRLEKEREGYSATVRSFRETYTTMMNRGKVMLDQLGDAQLQQILYKDKEFIEGSWTTAGLWTEMQKLFQVFIEHSNKLLAFSNEQIKGYVDAAYQEFHKKYGFPLLTPPALNLERHTLKMTQLMETTKEFCHNPANLARYKKQVIGKFYEELVEQARQVFEMTRGEAEDWLKKALVPINHQLKEHEGILSRRVDNVKKIRDNIGSVDDRAKFLQQQQVVLMKQSTVLGQIKTAIQGQAPVAPAPTPGPATIDRQPAAA
ncbi:MAG: dynamin family protein [Burkholderiales bacterium]